MSRRALIPRQISGGVIRVGIGEGVTVHGRDDVDRMAVPNPARFRAKLCVSDRDALTTVPGWLTFSTTPDHSAEHALCSTTRPKISNHSSSNGVNVMNAPGSVHEFLPARLGLCRRVRHTATPLGHSIAQRGQDLPATKGRD